MVPIALMWVVWRERRRSAYEGVESSFLQLRSSLRSLIFFWCKQKVPSCLEDWVDFVEFHILYSFDLLGTYVHDRFDHVYKLKYFYLIKKKIYHS